MSLFNRDTRRAADLLVVVSDTHINSTVALCPPKVDLDDGGSYEPSKVQRWIWERWLKFWREVEKRKAQIDGEVYVVSNGDAVDKNVHSAYQLISPNDADILRMGERTFASARALADYFFVVRGTEAHADDNAKLEEALAYRLRAEPNPTTGRDSWWDVPIGIRGWLFHFAHHPDPNSTRSYTRGGGANRTAVEVQNDYYGDPDNAPDIAVRSHVHHIEDSGLNHHVRVLFTPSWQFHTSFTYRIGIGGKSMTIGGLIFEVTEDQKPKPEFMTWQPKRTPVWTSQSKT